ncbi:MAG: 50S ribosomal protein L23 [Calditrichia bacterium]
MKDPRKVILEPILTEKALRLKDEFNQYVFKVCKDVNKIEIKRALEKRFDVQVKSLRVLNMRGKARQRYTKTGRVSGYTSGYKKAIVTLHEDSKLDFLENV